MDNLQNVNNYVFSEYRRMRQSGKMPESIFGGLIRLHTTRLAMDNQYIAWHIAVIRRVSFLTGRRLARHLPM